MKYLHILKSAPDDNTLRLIDLVNECEDESHIFQLYESDSDYEELIDQIFKHDKVISWW
jgi:hypothetical protein